MSNSKLFNMFEAAAKAGAGLEKAKASLTDRAVELLKTDVSVADISRDGRFLAMFQEATAKAILTPAQLAVYSDDTLATSQRVKGDDGTVKQIKTARGKLQDRVNSAIRNVRNAMKAVSDGGAARGTKTKSTPTEAFFKVIDAYVKRLSKTEEASDTFDFDPIVAKKHLVAMLKELR